MLTVLFDRNHARKIKRRVEKVKAELTQPQWDEPQAVSVLCSRIVAAINDNRLAPNVLGRLKFELPRIVVNMLSYETVDRILKEPVRAYGEIGRDLTSGNVWIHLSILHIVLNRTPYLVHGPLTIFDAYQQLKYNCLVFYSRGCVYAGAREVNGKAAVKFNDDVKWMSDVSEAEYSPHDDSEMSSSSDEDECINEVTTADCMSVYCTAHYSDVEDDYDEADQRRCDRYRSLCSRRTLRTCDWCGQFGGNRACMDTACTHEHLHETCWSGRSNDATVIFCRDHALQRRYLFLSTLE
jgi:hypothetical protein